MSETEKMQEPSDWYSEIAAIVSKACDSEKEKIIGSRERLFSIQCRWMLWYAYRYATKEPYDRIREMSERAGHRFTARAIGAGITKMSSMIDTDAIWRRRWDYIRDRLKELIGGELFNNDRERQYEIVVQVPKNIKVKVTQTN